MLASVTSREIAEWRAYERLNGPIGSSAYQEEALASMHEMLQHLARILIAQNVEDEDDIPDISHYPRPFEFMQPPETPEDQGG